MSGTRWLLAGLAILAMTFSAAAAEEGLIGHWTLREGKGAIAQDVSGQGHNGRIVNARWADESGAMRLRFDGADDYVDCGTAIGPLLTNDITLAAWIKLEGAPWPDPNTNWHVFNCEEYTKSGFMLRVDGAAAKLCFRTSGEGKATAQFSRGTLLNNTWHHVAVTRRAGRATLYIDGSRDVSFDTRAVALPTIPLCVSSPSQSFQGFMDDARVYNRALGGGELLALYKEGCKGHGKDTSWIGKISLQPFYRFDRKLIVVEADFKGVMPIAEKGEVAMELGPPEGEPLRRETIAHLPESGKTDFPFPLADLPDGQYEIRFIYVNGVERVTEKLAFHYPPRATEPPDPRTAVAAPLPPEPQPPTFEAKLATGGGLSLQVGGRRFEVDSAFSYPQGGENRFFCNRGDAAMEKTWRVTPQTADGEWRVTGEGAFYRIERRIRKEAGRVVFTDTITNQTDAPLGLLIDHRLNVGAARTGGAWLAGGGSSIRIRKKSVNTNPTVFLKGEGWGAGMVALDDVFIVQSGGEYAQGEVTLRTHEFALDSGAAYTMEWAVYLNATGDYYDFINAIRRDEGRNFVTVEGGFAGTHIGGNRRTVPTRDYLELRGAKHVLSGCLARVADDPAVSLEGVEFMTYPKEKALMREQMLGIRKTLPGARAMFHVAHSLYATNRPDELFPDSRVIQADGTQAVYPYNYEGYNYFSKERHADNWRWWIYYPTLDNSYGKALLESVDVMMDDMGCTAVFMDGFHWAYGGEYTYDRWDGHTAEIDPKTKTITRKKASVLLLSQPAMVAFVEKMRAKGGVVVANNTVVTRTMGKLDIVTDKEITEGPVVHLSQSPITMGNPAAIHTETDVHADVLAKLAWGNLYMYYGEGTLTHPSAPQQMYPITVTEIHSGVVKGRERIVTSRSGVFGWRGEEGRDLHYVYRYDGRGYPVAHDFTSTVEAGQARTQVDLQPDEIAILKRVPVTVKSAQPVNCMVKAYGKDAVVLRLNGHGATTVRLRNGEFAISDDGRPKAKANGTVVPANMDGDALVFSLDLNGPSRVEIR